MAKVEVRNEWDALTVPGVLDVIERVATNVARQYDMDADDLYQEATILVTDAGRDLVELAYAPEQHGLLGYRLKLDLTDLVKTEAGRRQRSQSFEERVDAIEAAPRKLDIRPEVISYDRELVEALLPAVWDESYCYGVRSETAPDPDMPRGSTNKATSGSLAAHIADIKRAWEKADLALGERQVLLLSTGLDWKQTDIAAELGISQPTASRWSYSGVGKLVAFLNGDADLLEQVSLDDAFEVAA